MKKENLKTVFSKHAYSLYYACKLFCFFLYYYYVRVPINFSEKRSYSQVVGRVHISNSVKLFLKKCRMLTPFSRFSQTTYKVHGKENKLKKNQTCSQDRTHIKDGVPYPYNSVTVCVSSSIKFFPFSCDEPAEDLVILIVNCAPFFQYRQASPGSGLLSRIYFFSVYTEQLHFTQPPRRQVVFKIYPKRKPYAYVYLNEEETMV